MSRLDDLIDLIQTTNEVYFITAPGRVRTAYILVDDIVELALKTFLQEKALEQREQFKTTLEQTNTVTNRQHRNALNEYYEESITLNDLSNRLNIGAGGVAQLQNYINALTPIDFLQHWSANEPDNFRNYPEVVRDVKLFFLAGHLVHTMLDEAAERHRVRNKFYHDHQHAGLTIDDDKCLRALYGMFDLMEQLFPGSPTTDSFRYLMQRNKTTRCQIGVLRLKLAAHGSNELKDPYILALKQFNKEHKISIESDNFEHSVLHTISERFFIAIRSHLKSKVDALESKLTTQRAKVDQMRSANQIGQQRAKIADTEYQFNILREQLTVIESLITAP
jgi:hypothetical protein